MSTRGSSWLAQEGDLRSYQLPQTTTSSTGRSVDVPAAEPRLTFRNEVVLDWMRSSQNTSPGSLKKEFTCRRWKEERSPSAPLVICKTVKQRHAAPYSLVCRGCLVVLYWLEGP